MYLRTAIGPVATLALLLSAGLVSANDGVQPEVVAKGLDNPCGVAVQASTGHVFVAGNGSVVRLVNNGGTLSAQPEITGFPVDVYGKGPMYNIGPLGLAFWDDNTLIVGDGSQKDGFEVVRFFNVGAEAKSGGDVIKADAAAYTVGPIKPGADSALGEGNFYGVAVKEPNIYITSNGDDTKGWILKIAVEGGKPGPLTPFIKTKVATNVDAPTGIAISPSGDLVVTQLGEINVPADSLLTVYDPATGNLKRKLPTGLNDLTGIAYSPKTGKLYGVDFSWLAPDKGGLFLLEPGDDAVKVTKLASLDKPTSLAFAKDGTLYIAAIGSANNGGGAPGSILRVKGL